MPFLAQRIAERLCIETVSLKAAVARWLGSHTCKGVFFIDRERIYGSTALEVLTFPKKYVFEYKHGILEVALKKFSWSWELAPLCSAIQVTTKCKDHKNILLIFSVELIHSMCYGVNMDLHLQFPIWYLLKVNRNMKTPPVTIKLFCVVHLEGIQVNVLEHLEKKSSVLTPFLVLPCLHLTLYPCIFLSDTKLCLNKFPTASAISVLGNLTFD